MTEEKSYIPSSVDLPEITLRVVILGILLSIILAVSNAYLALKIGMLTSASIPAAIISMGILRFFRNSNILENNLVQTAASAGEAVAGGIVYTIPALIIIHYWTGFDYWQNFFIALVGGIFGVMFSIPLRRLLMRNRKLSFPEGRAIAELLKISAYQNTGIRDILFGAMIGSILEFLQTGIKLLADSWEVWIKPKALVFGFGIGFSPALIGAGYLIGTELTMSIFCGALISWLILIPVFSHLYPQMMISDGSAIKFAHDIFNNKIRYVGIGAMLTAGLMTLANLVKPLLLSINLTQDILSHVNQSPLRIRTERDIPLLQGLIISLLLSTGLFFLYRDLFPLAMLNIPSGWIHTTFIIIFLYTLIAGFLFCAITAYMSGMVGVSASPGSAIIIASLLVVAFILSLILRSSGNGIFTPDQIKACEAIVIICTAVITGMAAISNDNMQDLKVGHILGSTPWKQQIMLIVGVICASLIVAPVMQLLFNVYGIAGVMPHSGMNAAESLPAPTAAVLATLSQAVFQQTIPWNLLFLGAAIVLLSSLANHFALKPWLVPLSIFGLAMGMYLPLSSSMSLFIGGLIAWLIHRKKQNIHRDMVLACGLIAGSAIMDVVLAIPFSLLHNPDAMNLAPSFWSPISIILSLLATAILYFCFKYRSEG